MATAAAALVVGAAAAAGLTWWVYERQADANWRHMDAALDAFPVPSGYRVVDRRRWGDMNCSINPSCVWPRAELDVQGSASLEQQCHDAEAAIRRWSRSNVPPKRDPESEGPNAACAWAGTVGPVRYWVSVSAEAGEGQLQVLVAPTVHDENLPHF